MAYPISYVKLLRSKATEALLRHPNSFTLLALTAQRACREAPAVNPYALQAGEALIGDYDAVGLTRQQFRTALAQLQKLGLATSRTTNKGTVIKLSGTDVYDINLADSQPPNLPNHQINQQTNQQKDQNPTSKKSNSTDFKTDNCVKKNSATNQQSKQSATTNSTSTSTTNKKENKKRKEIEENAAVAATPPSSISDEGYQNPEPAASRKKSAARAEEIAALALPHPGPKFAELWTAFLTSPKQAKKPITALKLILTKLGDYAEGFACQLLEDAIQGDWSGVVFDSTAEKYAKWRAAEAARAHRQPTRTNSATNDDPNLNHEFIAEVAARKQAEEDAHFARWHVPSVVVDPDKEFGYNQTAAEGLAQARATPEYQRYLAELEAAKKQAATDAEPAPPAPSPENPSDSPQQAA